MDAGPERSLRAIEDMRLQLAVDQLVASGVLDPAAAFEAASALDRVLAERGLLGLGLEAMRREARQQRRQARAQACEALRQHEQAAAQWARAVSRVGSAARPAASRRFAKSANGSDRPA